MPVLSTLFPAQIQHIVPCYLLWTKLTLPQPKPAQIQEFSFVILNLLFCFMCRDKMIVCSISIALYRSEICSKTLCQNMILTCWCRSLYKRRVLPSVVSTFTSSWGFTYPLFSSAFYWNQLCIFTSRRTSRANFLIDVGSDQLICHTSNSSDKGPFWSLESRKVNG